VTIQDLGNLGEFVAALATVATLVYVALQLRDNTRVTRFESHLKVRQLVVEPHRILSDPDRSRIWRVGLDEPDALSDDELLSFFGMLYLIVNALDARLEYRRTTRDPDPYEPRVDALERLATRPGFVRWWETAAPTYNTAMNERVEKFMRASSSEPQPPS
jgi:hypothetical protein